VGSYLSRGKICAEGDIRLWQQFEHGSILYLVVELLSREQRFSLKLSRKPQNTLPDLLSDKKFTFKPLHLDAGLGFLGNCVAFACQFHPLPHDVHRMQYRRSFEWSLSVQPTRGPTACRSTSGMLMTFGGYLELREPTFSYPGTISLIPLRFRIVCTI
jgi:hypothetical protein